MSQIPPNTLSKLRCAHCDGYLSHPPLTLTAKNEQICGECSFGHGDHMRLLALEALAQLHVFPCKYHQQGCSHEHPFGEGLAHQLICPHRYQTLPAAAVQLTESADTELAIRVQHAATGQVILNLEVKGQNGSELSLHNSRTNRTRDAVKIHIESVLSLESTAEVVYSKVNVLGVESEKKRNSLVATNCSNCNMSIFSNELYHCLFGHATCERCRGFQCLICLNSLSGERHFRCKNYPRGCIQLLAHSEVARHQIDCEFNNHKCPMNRCSFNDCLVRLILHLKDTHSNNLIQSHEFCGVVRAHDKNWYLQCYDKLFNLKYYYYGDFVEFIVKYMGSNRDASNFKYEVTVLSDLFREDVVKRTHCIGWNEMSLQKGVALHLRKPGDVEFEVRVAILRN